MNQTRGKNASMPNALQVYLREIKDESLLTAAEECALADAIARGDRDAQHSDDSGQPAARRQNRPRVCRQGNGIRGFGRRGKPGVDPSD